MNGHSDVETKTVTDAIVTCSEMVSDYLEAHGYDGLVEPNGECACALDNFMPCGGEHTMDCKAGYRRYGCTSSCGKWCNFHIIAGKKPE